MNYGVPEDYEQLAKLGIDVKGKIALARYGKSWRGTKAKVAQEHGAVGCLIYSDPREDGYFQGDIYPKGAFRPPDGAQRGSVMDMPIYPGDPLSPGWASEKGARKLALKDATTLMKIPVLPISYADAQPLLENLEGPVAPETWRGALPLTYHVGPGPATAHMKVESDWTTKPVYNVIATIPGSEFPDQWVIYGNHHDAWVNGAHDPASGAVAVLETARALAQLGKNGWKPKRTIKFVLWDAEEFGLIGSTEWVEKHEAELKNKAVVYFNSDTNGKAEFSASGSPSLHVFMRQIVRDVLKPEKLDFKMPAVGSGSDYVAFLQHSGIASVNAGFGDSGGVYHSIYDSFDWYTHFSDKDFSRGRSLTQIMSTALLRMADAPVLPFEFKQVVIAVRSYLNDLTNRRSSTLRASCRTRQTSDRSRRIRIDIQEGAGNTGGSTETQPHPDRNRTRPRAVHRLTRTNLVQAPAHGARALHRLQRENSTGYTRSRRGAALAGSERTGEERHQCFAILTHQAGRSFFSAGTIRDNRRMIVETQVVRFDSLPLDCGVILAPVDVAYETYGELNASRLQRYPGAARLFRRCARGGHQPRWRKTRLVGQHDRSRQSVRYDEIFRHLLERARRMQGHHGTGIDQPGDRPAIWRCRFP